MSDFIQKKRPRALLSAREFRARVEVRKMTRQDVKNAAINAPQSRRRNNTCVVQLGCHGDILNIFPLLEKLSREEPVKPTLLTLSNFMSLGRSIDYADFEMFPGSSVHELAVAKQYAERRHQRVLVSQCYKNPKDTPEAFAACPLGYNQREFYHAGYNDSFLRGEFDRINITQRDLKAEDNLFRATLGPSVGRPFVLVNALGVSAPFSQPERAMLFEAVRQAVPIGVLVLNMADIRAEYFALLLGLFERASLLVTIDTGTLHLAGAHKKIPYIGLVCDWPGMAMFSVTRGNCVLRMGYSEVKKPDGLAHLRRVITSQLCA